MELQATLSDLQNADEMLRMKYAEFAIIGKEKYFVEQPIEKLDSPVIATTDSSADSTSTLATTSFIGTAKKLGLKSIFCKKETNSIESLTSGTGSNDSLRFNANKNDLKLDHKGEVKYHKFVPYSYRSLKKCDLCQEKLWGKELKCDTCSYHCHNKCSSSVIIPCGRESSTLSCIVF
jgi:hypothetical protein